VKTLAIRMGIALVGLCAGSVVLAEPASGPAVPSIPSLPTRTPAEWYAMGGPTMHALVLCSMAILAVVLERAWALRPGAIVPHQLAAEIRRALEVGNRHELKALCERDRSVLGRLARLALEGESARERLEAFGTLQAHRAARNLPLLASLGNLATLLGLLGTVLGMIEAFELIAAAGTGDARVVAGGIFRALVTTAAGLGVGIGALAAHALFNRRAADLVVSLETFATEILDSTGPAARSHGDESPLERA